MHPQKLPLGAGVLMKEIPTMGTLACFFGLLQTLSLKLRGEWARGETCGGAGDRYDHILLCVYIYVYMYEILKDKEKKLNGRPHPKNKNEDI